MTTTASSSTSRTARRCAASPAFAPSSRTSPRSSTASCASSGSCSSGVWTEGPSHDAENSLAELAALAETAGSEVLEALIQRRDKPDPATYIGSGKARELRDVVVVATGADTVICDGELTPGQLQPARGGRQGQGHRPHRADPRHLRPARQAAGRARRRSSWRRWSTCCRGCAAGVSRCPARPVARVAPASGGVGTRGPGETKIETDRRRIRTKMAKLRREITEMKTARDTKRQERRRNEVPSVAIAGYTNAGKSSLLNRLTGAGVLVENALFATLDPTVRRAETPDGRDVHAHRHRRLRPAPAAPAGRGVPLDAGGGRRGRPDPARRRRLARRPRGPARRGARGARRDRRAGRPRARRHQQGRPRRPAGASTGCGAARGTPSSCRRAPA